MLSTSRTFSILLASLCLASCQSTGSKTLSAESNTAACSNYSGENLNPEAIKFEKILDVDPLTPGFSIFEGPVWKDGALLFSHIGLPEANKPNPSHLMQYKQGKLSEKKPNYGANGLTLSKNGKLLSARQLDGTITEVESGKVIAAKFMGKRFNSPNDLVIAANGMVYFTDPDWQSPKPTPQSEERAYYVSSDGAVSSFGGNVKKPNGVMLSLDESHLYLGGTNGLYKFKLAADGSVIDEPKAIGAIAKNVDGLSKDCAGNIVVTADGQVIYLSPMDEIIARYDIAGVTNVAFGGDDGKTLFATSLGGRPALYQAIVNVPGYPF